MAEKTKLVLCLGSSCFARGNSENLEYLEDWIQREKPDAELSFSGCLCTGNCKDGPVLQVNDTLYRRITKPKIGEILEKTFGSFQENE